ncbi:uncharacterized protein LOC116200175 [Punica granatum]|uniref:Uncharacterized protein LOC116200175 n=2 Tax=Punica granatum TaxID=22663 RepID=A0A6P8CZF4_PUNGR|nr:uncharacterized protein LOC116200175 [Punica granatum]PKI37467.1 hypothetical protein CRG98_042129 [Punica granatum]
MAAVLSPTRSLPNPALPPASSSVDSIPSWSRFQNSCFRTSYFPASPIILHRPFLPYPLSRPGLCRAASPGPGEPGPPSDDRPLRLKGIGSSLSKLTSTVQIFFAVLFWMSLFFWASAWDGRNRPNNGSGGFRR